MFVTIFEVSITYGHEDIMNNKKMKKKKKQGMKNNYEQGMAAYFGHIRNIKMNMEIA